MRRRESGSATSSFFSSLIDGCLKYTNKEKPKTGLRPGPRLSYDVKIGPKPGSKGVEKSGPGLKFSALIPSQCTSRSKSK